MFRNPSFHESLSDPRLYERQIERLQNHGRTPQVGDLSPARLSFHRANVARLLAETVSQGEYLSGPAQRKTIVVDGKERVIFKYRLIDEIVHGAVADLLAAKLAPGLSSRLYSYRKGLAWWVAVSDFSRFLRAWRKKHPDPRQRHMYVLRRDIDSYTDSIPVGTDAPVWRMLRDLLASAGPLALSPADWQLLQNVVRPVVERPGEQPVPLERGVATGQPISCVLFNLYLAGLDQRLETLPGGFYARYSDDILYAHPAPEAVRAAAAEIDSFLAGLGLRVKPAKSKDLYLTGAGRSSSDWPEAVGATTVPFMGVNIRADGTVSLGRKKTHKLFRDIVARVRRVVRSLRDCPGEDLGRTICATINQMFRVHSNLLLEAPSTALVRRVVTDRGQLAQFDYWIARIVLRAVTGDARARAFRKVPYRKIREEWRLISLEHARNLCGRRSRR